MLAGLTILLLFQYWRTLSDSLAPIVVVLLVSTVVTIAVTALVVRAMSRGDGTTPVPATDVRDAVNAADPK